MPDARVVQMGDSSAPIRRTFTVAAKISIEAKSTVPAKDVQDRVARWARQKIRGTGGLQLLELKVVGDGVEEKIIPPPAAHEHAAPTEG